MESFVDKVMGTFQHFFKWPKSTTDITTINFWSTRGWDIEEFRLYFEHISKDKKQLKWLSEHPSKMNLSGVLNISPAAVQHIEDTMLTLKWKSSKKAVLPKSKNTFRCRAQTHFADDYKSCEACLREGNLIELICSPASYGLATPEIQAMFDWKALIKLPEETGPDYVKRTYELREKIYKQANTKTNPLAVQLEMVDVATKKAEVSINDF